MEARKRNGKIRVPKEVFEEAEKNGICRQTLYNRIIQLGWPEYEAKTLP